MSDGNRDGREATDQGAPRESDSSGYANAQNQADRQDQENGGYPPSAAYGNSTERGAAFDEAQGGGRGGDDLSEDDQAQDEEE